MFATAVVEQIKLRIWTEDTWLLILYLILSKSFDTLFFHSQSQSQLHFSCTGVCADVDALAALQMDDRSLLEVVELEREFLSKVGNERVEIGHIARVDLAVHIAFGRAESDVSNVLNERFLLLDSQTHQIKRFLLQRIE